MTESEELFEQYLSAAGVDFEAQPRLASSRSLDFKIEKPARIYVEVTELNPADVTTTDGEDFRKAIRRKIKDKAIQARDLAAGEAFVIVVYQRSGAHFYDVEIPGAMFGDPGLVIPIDQTGKGRFGLGEAFSAWFRGGRLQKRLNTRVAGVAGIRLIDPNQVDLDEAVARHLEATGRAGHELDEIWEVTSEVASLLADKPSYDPDARVIGISYFRNLYSASAGSPCNVFRGEWDVHWGAFDGKYVRTWIGAEAQRVFGKG